MHDWEIMSEAGKHLTRALGVGPRPVYPPTAILDMGLKAGPYGKASGSDVGLDFKTLAAHPPRNGPGGVEALPARQAGNPGQENRVCPRTPAGRYTQVTEGAGGDRGA